MLFFNHVLLLSSHSWPMPKGVCPQWEFFSRFKASALGCTVLCSLFHLLGWHFSGTVIFQPFSKRNMIIWKLNMEGCYVGIKTDMSETSLALCIFRIRVCCFGLFYKQSWANSHNSKFYDAPNKRERKKVQELQNGNVRINCLSHSSVLPGSFNSALLLCATTELGKHFLQWQYKPSDAEVERPQGLLQSVFIRPRVCL